ncbi:MipA/OmpV family protein [Colwellia sp. RSH04]|uniref:MipA/OmpV family protein n=1 Tax=Colwellia sp. RSH04 TaxID=2305464 RepID=UPI000E5956FF|nr:MipA/OmpV family protein [Colwellia sp. RSH04]RHW77803.1 MipA/OmpV family protein [Colwellia sp. RSH04]
MIFRIILIVFMVFTMIKTFPALAARDVTQIHLEPGSGLWSIGMGLRNGTFPYVGKDKVDDLLPLIIYNGETFFIDGTRAGFHLYQSSDWLIGAYTSYRFAGFNEEDGIELDGMDRNDGMDGRFALTRLTNYGNITLDYGHDISGASNGWDIDLRWGKLFTNGNYRIRPWIGITYEDQKLSNYYFGVNADEATSNRPAYTTNSSFEMRYGIDMSYRIAQHHFVALNIQYSELDATKINSPIVIDNGEFSSFASYRYEFNDYKDNPYVNGSITKDLTMGEWYWRVAAGRHTETTFNKLLRFQEMFKPEERGTGLASIFVGKKIADNFMWLPLEAYVTGGYVRRFEKGLQNDFNEYVLGFKAYFSKFPWSDYVKTRIGLAEGVSYAAKVPFVEREHVEEKNRSASKFLNYLDWSIDVSIGDVFKVPKLKDCYMGWSVHHRSGIFASSDFFGNVNGGSNVNTLYVQCHNNVM